MVNINYKFHVIYTIIREDGFFYKGLHSTNNLDDGYTGSGLKIKLWIKKYGKDAFWSKHRKIIEEFLPSRIALEQREAEIITPELLRDPKCMNLSTGGRGGSKFTGKKHSIEAKQKMGEASRNLKRTKEHCSKISKSLLGKQNFLGKTHTPETIEKMRLAVVHSEKRRKLWRPCTIDGVTIFESAKAMKRSLGAGKNGFNSPNFRYISITKDPLKDVSDPL